MTTFENIEGAEALISKLHSPIGNLDADIEQLKVRQSELTAQLDKGENRFKLNILSKNRAVQSELDLINRTLRDAESERERLIKAGHANTYQELYKIIGNHKASLRDSKKAENAEMIKKIHEIRAIFKSMQEYEKEAYDEMRSLVDSVLPFISDEPISRSNQNTPKEQIYRMIDVYSQFNDRLKFIDVFNQSSYGIKGLINTHHKPGQFEKETDAKYGITE